MTNDWQTYFVISIVSFLAASTGCLEIEMEMDESFGVIEQAALSENALEPNGLPANGLPNNGLPNNGLPNNGLPNNGLPNNGLPSSSVDGDWKSWITHSTRGIRNRLLMKYMVKCALDDGEDSSFDDGNDLWTWNGRIGLAKAWRTLGMTAAEKKWVSSCVASLVNSAGVSITVSQRGKANSPIDSMETDEEDSHTDLEGAYFGDAFSNPPALYTCKGNGYNSAVNTGRTCPLASGNCPPLQHKGNCADICSVENRTVDGVSFDVYYDCDPDGVGGEDPYAEVTTIYLNPTL